MLDRLPVCMYSHKDKHDLYNGDKLDNLLLIKSNGHHQW